jgi:uncharacterized protein (TIGR00266 family)
MILKYEFSGRPAYSILKVWLEPGEAVWSEPGAMVLVRGNIEVETKSVGLSAGFIRRLFGGESFFLNQYRAGPGGGEVWFAPSVPGDIEAINVNGEWIVQDTSYLAHYGDIEVSAKFTGLKGLIAEGELFWIKVEGNGIVWVNSYGSIEKVNVPVGEKVIVDNYHLVAMPANVDFTIRKFGKLKTFLFGGEGFVVEIRGPAIVYLQTRILPPLAALISKYVRTG